MRGCTDGIWVAAVFRPGGGLRGGNSKHRCTTDRPKVHLTEEWSFGGPVLAFPEPSGIRER